MPVAVAHVFLVQTVSALASHTTMVGGFTLQLYGSALVSQYSVPLQKLPSSWLAQSAVTLQPHWLAPLTHTPALQTSPTVQPLPSSQLVVLLVCVQPAVALHASLVQRLLSSQFGAGHLALLAGGLDGWRGFLDRL